MIRHLYVDNFKALNDFEMEAKQFLVIVGNNMSGKSTVLQALDFLANVVKEDFHIILERRGWKVSDVKSQINKSNKLTVRCKLEFWINEKSVNVLWELQINAYTQKNVMELHSEKVLLLSEDGEIELLKYTASKGCEIRGGQKAELLKVHPQSSVLKVMDFGDMPVLNALKQFFVNSDSFELLSPEKMRLSSRGEVSTIGNAGEKLPAFVKSMTQEQKARFNRKIKSIFGDRICDVDARTKGKPGWTQLTAKEQYRDNVMTIESKNMSDGTLRLLAFLAICEIDKSDMMMLLDEIENGINIDYAEKLLNILKKECAEKRKQLIVTTHSPMFLDYVPKENIQYMYRDPEKGNSRCSLLSESKELKEKMDYLYPGELMMNLSNNEIISILLSEQAKI